MTRLAVGWTILFCLMSFTSPTFAQKMEAVGAPVEPCEDCRKSTLRKLFESVVEILHHAPKPTPPAAPKWVPPPVVPEHDGEFCGSEAESTTEFKDLEIKFVNKYDGPASNKNRKCKIYFSGICDEYKRRNGTTAPPLLNKLAAVADKLRPTVEACKDSSHPSELCLRSQSRCLNYLHAMYDQCSVMKEVAFFDRFIKMKKISDEVAKVPGLNRKINSETMVCIAARESSNFEPLELNSSACKPLRPTTVNVCAQEKAEKKVNGYKGASKGRKPASNNFSKAPVDPKCLKQAYLYNPQGIKIDDLPIMKNWISTAYGPANVVFSTVKDEWKSRLSQALVLDINLKNTGKSFEAIYKNPENLFKMAVNNPVLQMQIMANYLNTIITKFKKSRGDLVSSVNLYDTRNSNCYATPVDDCAKCIKNIEAGKKSPDKSPTDCLKLLYKLKEKRCK